MAELHIVGTLMGASDFPSSELTCKYAFNVGDDWKCLEGEEWGQTHVDSPDVQQTLKSLIFRILSSPSGVIRWVCIQYKSLNALLDVHYATKSIKGWPKLVLQVYHQDMFGRNELCKHFGNFLRLTNRWIWIYSYSNFARSAYARSRDLETCRQFSGSTLLYFTDSQLISKAYFLGATPQLKNLDLITNPADRFRLETMTMGKVYLEVSVVTRNFDTNGVVL